MIPFFQNKIWFCTQSVDFRKQIDGLVMLIADQLKQDPGSGQIYIFRSKRDDRIKLLYWDRNGFWLFYKRLEKGKFKFPNSSDIQFELNSEQLQWLLSGLNILNLQMLPTVTTTHYF